MQKELRLLLVAGARPNFMKVAPLIHAIRAHKTSSPAGCQRIDYTLVHTGQHYDQGMSEVFFQELGIPTPDVNLEVGSGSHAAMTANVMLRFESALEQAKPDWVVVVGDVNSTMACTLVASKLGIRIAHVEAGLRSFDRTMPEEINRLVTDSLADLLLTPSEDANVNLGREGVAASRIHLVGNIMIDALVANLARARDRRSYEKWGCKPGQFAYVTLHRPSNVDQAENLSAIIRELKALSQQLPVVFPVHPRTRKRMLEFGLSVEAGSGLKLVDPVGYHDSLCLTEHARLVLTDSGGLQEEATYFRTPCLTLRKNTERPITVSLGSNRLTTPAELASQLSQVCEGPPRTGQVPPLWDGRTSERILRCLIDHAN